MILCTNCGTDNQKDSKFCQACGSSLVVQSNVVNVSKKGTGENKVLSLESREERFRKAKQFALKAIKDVESQANSEKSNLVHIGEKIL